MPCATAKKEDYTGLAKNKCLKIFLQATGNFSVVFFYMIKFNHK